MLLLLFRSRRIDVRSHWGFLREREFRGFSSIFSAARKYGSGWIGQVILIGWKCSATLTVKLNYAPNKNTSFFLLQVFGNGSGDRGSIPGRVIPKTQKKVLDSALFSTQHYKVRIKFKVEQWSSAPPSTPLVALDYGHQLYFYFICLFMYSS